MSEQDYFEQFVGDTDEQPVKLPAMPDLTKCYNCKGTGVEPSFFHGQPPKCHICGGTGRMIDARPMGGPNDDVVFVFPSPRRGKRTIAIVGEPRKPPPILIDWDE